MSRRPPSASAIREVGLELFVFAGRLGTVEEEELRAEQSDTVGAVTDCFEGVLAGSDVGEDLDGHAVGR